MSKTLVGALLIVLGIGGCVASPILLMRGEDPDQLLEDIGGSFAADLRVFEPGVAPAIDVETPGMFTVFVVRESGSSEDRMGAVGLPSSSGFRFLGADGAAVDLETQPEPFEWRGSDGQVLVGIGSASLSAGHWTVEVPESASGRQVAIGRFEIPGIILTILIAEGIGFLVFVAGVVVMLIGILGRRRAPLEDT